MNIHDAAHATVHDYPGGAASLAPRLGMVQAVLNSKVNPNTHTHHLTLAEAMRIMTMTGDHRILRAQCEELEREMLDFFRAGEELLSRARQISEG